MWWHGKSIAQGNGTAKVEVVGLAPDFTTRSTETWNSVNKERWPFPILSDVKIDYHIKRNCDHVMAETVNRRVRSSSMNKIVCYLGQRPMSQRPILAGLCHLHSRDTPGAKCYSTAYLTQFNHRPKQRHPKNTTFLSKQQTRDLSSTMKR